ncbi:SMI1/KNR4 family protein [Kribbella sp. NPDC050241]|uniref:SMI1/KNR4 family protein n=1 Tax=Kribbella sp. NPDC050241 TaxID=3364115 RepID=UPI0037921625
MLTQLAEEIAEAAPRGWKRAELHGYAVGQGGTGHRGFWFEPKELNEYGANDIDVHGGMTAVHTLMEAAEHLTIDLELESRGRYRAVLSERLDRADDRGFRYLVDKESEPPEPRAAPSDAAEAGDAVEAVALFNEYRRRLEDLLGPSSNELPPPLPATSVPLPRDLSALYAVVDGDGGRGMLHGFGWFGLDTLEHFADQDERWWVTHGWQRYVDSYSFVKDYGPPGAVRRLADHPAWIPFATDTFGNYLAVDMAPGPNGRPGQVILIGRSYYRGPVYVADSVTELLRRHVDALVSDRVERDDDEGLWINAGDVSQYERQYDENCTLELTGRDAAPVTSLTAELRELSVHNAPWVDLRPVGAAPALQKFSVRNVAGVDLSPLLATPVEVLDLGTDTIDLSGLRGHPTVSQVVLRSEKPIDLLPLASCPSLYALDLTDAPAAEQFSLGHLTGLRYLRMQRLQWKDFLSHQTIPPRLAVAELAEEPLEERKHYWSFANAYKPRRPTLDDALEWAGQLTRNATGIVTITGRFTRR